MPAANPSATLGREFLLDVRVVEQACHDPVLFVVERKGKRYTLCRKGSCDFRACNAVCCRMLVLEGAFTPYLEGFAKKGRHAPIIPRTCRYLAEDCSCRRWNAPDFPTRCANFPVPGDALYLEVMDSCAFSFELAQDLGPLERTSRLTD